MVGKDVEAQIVLQQNSNMTHPYLINDPRVNLASTPMANLLYQVQSFVIPAALIKAFAQENLVELERAQRWFVEYKKFVFL